MGNRIRNEAKERLWREHVSAWQESELSIRQYCLQHQLSEANFYAWRRELARRDELAVVQSRVLHTDDTRVSMQDKATSGKTTSTRFWTYVGDDEHPLTVFDFTLSATRWSGLLPEELLRSDSGGWVLCLRWHRDQW